MKKEQVSKTNFESFGFFPTKISTKAPSAPGVRASQTHTWCRSAHTPWPRRGPVFIHEPDGEHCANNHKIYAKSQPFPLNCTNDASVGSGLEVCLRGECSWAGVFSVAETVVAGGLWPRPRPLLERSLSRCCASSNLFPEKTLSQPRAQGAEPPADSRAHLFGKMALFSPLDPGGGI